MVTSGKTFNIVKQLRGRTEIKGAFTEKFFGDIFLVTVPRPDCFDRTKPLVLKFERVIDKYESLQYSWYDEKQKTRPYMTVKICGYKDDNTRCVVVEYRREPNVRPYKTVKATNFINMTRKYRDIAFYFGDVFEELFTATM